MFKHKKAKKHSKTKIKKEQVLRYCFYYIYKSFYMMFVCFFQNFLHINMYTLSIKKQKSFGFPVRVFTTSQPIYYSSILILG